MISSIGNPRVKAARKLQSKRQREAQMRVLLEGGRLINDALQSAARPCEVFFSPALTEGNPLARQLLAQLTSAGVPCLECTPEVIAALAETVNTQGIVAVLPLPQLSRPRRPTLTLILDQVREPGNAGTLLRAAEAAGVEWVITTPGTVDLFNDKVLRAGMGAHFRLPVWSGASWDGARAALPPGQSLYVADAHAARAYDQVDWREPAILVVGGEATGAGPQLRALATPLAIPMHGGAESLNAAIAGAVMLFEAARQRRQGALEAKQRDIDRSRPSG